MTTMTESQSDKCKRGEHELGTDVFEIMDSNFNYKLNDVGERIEQVPCIHCGLLITINSK